MLAMLVPTLLAFAIVPAFAVIGGTVKAPTIVDANLGPGSTFTFDVTAETVMVPNNLWNTAEPAIRDVNNNGQFDTTTDVVLVGFIPPNTAPLSAWASNVKYYDNNTNTIWDVKEPAIRDLNITGFYDTADVVLLDPFGIAAGLDRLPGNVPLSVPGALDKFYDTTPINSVEFKMSYNKAVLTATGIVRNRVAPVALAVSLYQTIDDTTGTITFGAKRTSGGFDATFAQILALITFTVDSRGISAFNLYDIVLKDTAGNVIAGVTDTDGIFDNRIEGIISVPHIVDTSMIAGSYFDLYVDVDDVTKLWGVSFILKYDPNVIRAIDYAPNATLPKPGFEQLFPSEIGPDYVAMAFSRAFGDTVGLTTTVPLHAARIGFNVVGSGVTTLDLQVTVLTNVKARKLVHVVTDGSFCNELDIAVAMDTGFVDHRVSKATTPALALVGQVKNVGTGITRARMVFTVLDADGLPVLGSPVVSGFVDVFPGGSTRISGSLNLDPVSADAEYTVIYTVQYVSAPNGDLAGGYKGQVGAHRTSMVKSFVVEP